MLRRGREWEGRRLSAAVGSLAVGALTAGWESPRAMLARRLLARHEEIKQALLARISSLEDPAAIADPTYREGLRGAVGIALGYAIGAVEREESRPRPIPAPLFAQAREAARNGVSLDTVLRRYVAGYTLLGDFTLREADAMGLPPPVSQEAMRAEAAVLDHLVAAIAAEYHAEVEDRSRSLQRHRGDLVEKLLAGQLSDAKDLNYDLDGWHVAAIAVGLDRGEALRERAVALDRRPLLVQRGEGTIWAWFGGGREIGREEMEQFLASPWPPGASVVLGEPGQGLAGWRLTHRQAAATLPIARRGRHSPVRYSDVALLSSVLQDEVLISSLQALYLKPLEEDRDEGATLRRTLRAYFASERNVSSTAMRLDVNRKTVTTRLRAIEERLDRPIASCAAELETALSLEELEDDGAADD